jgi:hypothetical protein
MTVRRSKLNFLWRKTKVGCPMALGPIDRADGGSYKGAELI